MFSIFALHKTLYFIAEIDAKISKTALYHYLKRPYKEFVEASPASLTKHILEDASVLGAGIIYPLIQIISKSVIIIFISLLLIVINYKVFISSFFIITIIYIIIYKSFYNTVKKSGEERVVLNDQRYKTTRDVFNSLKEVKFYSLEDYYHKDFSKSASGFANIDARIGFLSTIPKFIIETIMFGIIFTSIIYIIFIFLAVVTYYIISNKKFCITCKIFSKLGVYVLTYILNPGTLIYKHRVQKFID